MVGNSDLPGFGPVLGRGHLEKFTAQTENRKTHFPGGGGISFGKYVRPESFSPKLRNFFIFCVLADRNPTGKKSQNAGFLGPWHLEKFRAKNRKMQFPGARGTFGGEIPPPQKFLPKIAQLFDVLRFDRPDP